MWKFGLLTKSRLPLLLAVLTSAALAVGLAWPRTGAAQDKTSKPEPAAANAQPPDKPDPHADKDLVAQVAELNDKVAKLEAAVQKSQTGNATATPATPPMPGSPPPKPGISVNETVSVTPGSPPAMPGMASDPPGKSMTPGKGMDGMSKMSGMMDKGMPGMSNMPGAGMEMMAMMGKGPMQPGAMPGMAQAASALPGFPGAWQIYHIGATGFFLDHPQQVTLTTEQQTALDQFKEKALLDKDAAQQKIEDAEQELWQLTASDAPNAAAIQEKVQAIEKLRGDQRIAYIRAVGESAKVLTDEQRKMLIGTMPPMPPKADVADPHAGHQHGTDAKDKP